MSVLAGIGVWLVGYALIMLAGGHPWSVVAGYTLGLTAAIVMSGLD